MDLAPLIAKKRERLAELDQLVSSGDFFATLRDKLKPGGLACIQTITIRDDLFERYVHSTDFIQQYIFPGGLLPSPQ